MRTKLFCENQEAPVTPFVGRFAANVCLSIAVSLKAPVPHKMLQFILQRNAATLQIDDERVLLAGFAETLVCDTLRGMISHLKGLEAGKDVRILIELEDQA
jgi:hypothetical protein